MKMNSKVIFLDVDGVLNGDNPKYRLFSSILYKISTKLYYKWDYFGVRWEYVFRLWILVKLTKASIVMSSSWKGQLNLTVLELMRDDRRIKSLIHKFLVFRLLIYDKTESNNGHRGTEIKDWLSNHPEITKFVILDDESFDIESIYPDQLVKTSNRIYDLDIHSENNSGLKWKHVIRAIRILNK